jgi:hypothetical protein
MSESSNVNVQNANVNLPSELRLAKFAEARIKEIIALSGFISKCFFFHWQMRKVTALLTTFVLFHARE